MVTSVAFSSILVLPSDVVVVALAIDEEEDTSVVEYIEFHAFKPGPLVEKKKL